MPRSSRKKGEKTDRTSPVTREYTVNLHKRLYKVTYKKRTPRAVRELRKFAVAAMGTKDVRITVGLNQFLWARGIKNPPRRVRVRLSRKRNEDQNAKDSVYTLITHVPVTSYKGLVTGVVEEQ